MRDVSLSGQPPDTGPGSDDVSPSGYRFDLFLSYRRGGTVPDWVHNHLHPLLLDCLADELSREPRIFLDSTMETGVHWPSGLEWALRRSRLLLPIWSPPYFTSPWYGLPLYILAAFCLYFFRDPERAIPNGAVVVSPADGKVTDVSSVLIDGVPHTRISIFLNVFNVHVNRSPLTGVIRDVRYQKGKYLNAMNPASAELNEQNAVTVEGDGQTVMFKQIAGLLARRIVFNKKVGDRVERGERVGLIKFGSRVDVVLGASATTQIKVGDRVRGGASVLGHLRVEAVPGAAVGAGATHQGAR